MSLTSLKNCKFLLNFSYKRSIYLICHYHFSSVSASSAVIPSSARNQRSSISLETRSGDAISVDTGLKKKKAESFSASSSVTKVDMKLEKRSTTEHLKSVPESEEGGTQEINK